MKSTLYTGLVAGVALFYCTLTCVCQNISPEIHFHLVRETLITVSVKANGQGPFEFFLDTGSNSSVIDKSLADQLGLTRSGQAFQVSLGDRRMVDRGRLSNLTLGPAQVDGLPVLIEDLAPLRQYLPHIKGIVGQQFLCRFNYLLDYEKRTVRFESGSELRDSIEGFRVPMEPRGDPGRDLIVVAADASAVRRSAVHLALDSGATSLVLMRDTSQRLEVPLAENRWVQTPGGAHRVHCGSIRLITLGKEQLRDVTVAISTDAATAFGDGLLPTSLFKSLYFNNRENFVILNPRGDGTASSKSNRVRDVASSYRMLPTADVHSELGLVGRDRFPPSTY